MLVALSVCPKTGVKIVSIKISTLVLQYDVIMHDTTLAIIEALKLFMSVR